jgi:hypothetical protein
MSTRTINITLIEQTPQVRTVRFIPVLSALDDGLLIESDYTTDTDEEGVGTIDLPVKDTGTIRYDYEIPSSNGVTTGRFYLAAGADIDLDDLIVAGGAATDSLIELINEIVTAAVGPIVNLQSFTVTITGS